MLYNLKVFRGLDLNSIIGQVYNHVLTQGQSSAPRGQEVLEAPRPVVLDLGEDRSPWTLMPGRKLNPYFAIAEVIWILAGRKDVNFIAYYNKNMPQFSTNGVDFDGAYGDRLRNFPVYSQREQGVYFSDDARKVFDLDFIDQIALVCHRLRQDPSSRQAVMSLWDPARDLKEGSKDYPCNNLCYFTLRNGSLDMSVIRRSNDMIWGLPYNQIQFYFIHALIAGELDAKVGRYTEFVQNMHVYTQNYPQIFEHVKSRIAEFGDEYLTEPDVRENPDMRITLSQFETFKGMFFELETDWRCMYPVLKSSHVKVVAERMEAQGVPEFWARTMLYVPLAYIAKKRKNVELHDFLLSQIDYQVLWMVVDHNGFKEKI